VSKLIKISFAIATGMFRSTSRPNNRNEVKLFLVDVTWTNLQQETTAIRHLHRMKTISRESLASPFLLSDSRMKLCRFKDE